MPHWGHRTGAGTEPRLAAGAGTTVVRNAALQSTDGQKCSMTLTGASCPNVSTVKLLVNGVYTKVGPQRSLTSSSTGSESGAGNAPRGEPVGTAFAYGRNRLGKPVTRVLL